MPWPKGAPCDTGSTRGWKGSFDLPGPTARNEEWTLFAIGLEAILHQFFEPDPERADPPVPAAG